MNKTESDNVGRKQTGTKRKNIEAKGLEVRAVVEANAESNCNPTIHQLALIAAHLMNRHNGNAGSAASEAIQVWHECVEAVELAAEFEYFRHEAQTQDTRPDLSFDDLLRKLMPKIDAGIRRKRFNDYLLANSNGSASNCDLVTPCLNRKFRAHVSDLIDRQFKDWWAMTLSEMRRKAAVPKKNNA
jgi:hypothetical protein